MSGTTGLSPEGLYHTGFVVPRLERAMEGLSAATGASWTAIEEQRMRLLTPQGTVRETVRFAYSRQGPLRMELIEPVAGTCWEQPQDGHGLGSAHHIGFWSDDLADASDRLAAAGLPRMLTLDVGTGRAKGFAYHRLPDGGHVELVESGWREGLEDWFAGGSYPGR